MEPEFVSEPPTLGAAGLARHAAWNYLAMLATLVSGFVVIAIAFREVKTELLGVYTIAAASTALLAMSAPAIAFGVTRSTARLTSGPMVKEELEFVHGSHAILVALGCSVGAGAGGIGVALWATAAVTFSWHVWLMLGLLVSALLVQLVSAVLPAAAVGMQDFRANAVASGLLAVTSLAVVTATIRVLDVGALGLGQFLGMTVSRAYLLRWAARRATWLRLRPERPRRATIASLVRFSGPMILIAIAAQLVTWTDVVSVGALVGASSSALYRAGSLPATQATGLLWRAYDVVFPLLSRSSDRDQERATSLLIRVFAALSGVVFAAMIAVRRDIISAVTGDESSLAQFVLVAFCLIWAINVPAHGLSLLAIARGQQTLYVPIVLAEVVLNIALTVALVSAVGARGAALATLLTILLSNMVALPLVLRRSIPCSFRFVLLDGVAPLLVSGAITLVALSALGALDPRVVRLGLQGVAASGLAASAVACAGGAAGRRALRASVRRQDGP